ncbi:PEP/pyruvate-binding domain-containing protein [Kibdelosporangium phytohabitans]|uniref:Pyruvate phosphate dikinase n=1 Tax=Kibdelosporangium phytohabitans TaxID=860235 RepID=A0A0N9I8P9_9PSEU|nr:PEP/pyruvate-binding domain-containing protein [Kibdelosporangium phytohabitans]ALG14684.1 pyruvate phosphate dikinase [Kibdelosporangium phytohabitans]MBE1471873.1 pyruvate,water dikinase [Kibdelosporangium phytohabitans]
MTHPLILSLADPGADLVTVGGKGASLARLTAAGIPVPAGFCVTTSAHRDFVSACGDVVPSAVADAVRSAYSALAHGNPVPVAVRSSATAEDSAELSFAGQHDTFLNVTGDGDVLDAVRRCWASLWTERAVHYRAGNNVSSPDMAVVVQLMVPATAAGVMFTADPVTGARDTVVINAAWGLGEAVVSGDVTPDTYTLAGGAVRSVIAEKTVMTVLTADGTATDPVPVPKRCQRVLSDDQVRELGALGRRIEQVCGTPVDVEWAVHDGQFTILQARPVTTLPVPFEVWNDTLLGDYLWTCANLREAVPSVMTPATWSLARSFALPPIAGHPTSGNIGGRFYLNVSTAMAVLTALGLAGVARRTATQIFGEIPAGMPIPQLAVSRLAVLRATVSAAARLGRDFRAYRKNLDALVAANPRRCSALRARISATSSAGELARLWRSDIADLLVACRTFDAGARQAGAARLGVRLGELAGPSDAALLLSGLHTSTDELASLGPVMGLARLRRGEITAEEYLQAWGHRGHDEFEISVPRAGEDPAWIKRLLDGMTSSPEDLLVRQAAARAGAWERLRAAHPREARRLAGKLERAAESARKRERARSEFARSFWVFRVFAQRASELTGHDMFFLSFNEIVDVLDGATGPLAAIPARQAAYAHYSALPPYPTLISGRFDPEDAVDAGPDASAITGFAGVPGVVTGTARVVSTVEEAEALRDGEILVTTVTNIGWTPLFPRAAAVVTDIGAPLSHAAIVARELGIPAVVGCGNATSALSTGDRIRVDAGKGTVTRLG